MVLTEGDDSSEELIALMVLLLAALNVVPLSFSLFADLAVLLISFVKQDFHVS